MDKNLTACRIACFSLYLAFLDQFDPPDVRAYMEATGETLPNLLRFHDPKKKADIPVVWEEDFFALAPAWKDQFDSPATQSIISFLVAFSFPCHGPFHFRYMAGICNSVPVSGRRVHNEEPETA